MSSITNNWKAVVLLLVLAVQCFYVALGAKPMYKTQEVRVAETAREMNANQNWVIPYYDGDIRLRKPPLAYWFTAASYAAFNTVSEFSARFASATFASLLVFALYGWLRRSSSADDALFTVLCLMTSYTGLRYFRSAETDAMLLFFTSAACMFAYQLLYVGVTTQRVLLLHLCMGLGFLTKGPAALAIPISVMLILGLKERRYDTLKTLLHPVGLPLTLLLAFGWYALIYFKIPDMAAYWVAEEIDATYITGRRPEPFYWYATHFFQFFLPWSLLLIPAALWYWKKRPHEALARFALVWFVATFIILSLNINKQPQYALLLATPLAVVLGHYLAAAKENFERANRYILYTLVAIATVAAFFLVKKATGHIEVGTVLLLFLGAAVPFAVAKLLRMQLSRMSYAALMLTGFMSAGWVYAQNTLYKDEGNEATTKAFALTLRDYVPLYLYMHGNSRIAFYTHQVLPRLKDEADAVAALARERRPIYMVIEGDTTPAWLSERNAVRTLQQENFQLWKLDPSAEPLPQPMIDKGPHPF